MRVVGVALSPEYVYAIGPGMIFPDDRSFGVIWMPRADLGVGHVDRHRDVADAQAGEALRVLREREPVRREAEGEVGRGAADPLERRVRRGRVRERVAGAGDADDGELRHLGGDGEHLAHRLLRREPLGDHAGPALVRAVVLAVAVVALDVALQPPPRA